MNIQIYIYSYLVIGLTYGFFVAEGLRKSKSGEIKSLEEVRWFYSDSFIYGFAVVMTTVFWPVFAIKKIIYLFGSDDELDPETADKVKGMLESVRDSTESQKAKDDLQKIIDELNGK